MIQLDTASLRCQTEYPPRAWPRQWSLQDAKNKLSEVIGAAATAPQIVMRRGVKTAVVISYRDYVRVAEAVGREQPSFEQFERD
ncbi:MAG TPA: type II toxin-antitoxin system prevent-host-death family antitoxin [Gemmatimonadaceae bacterium]|nr:type II toxin-antitoxin system prevent-host-death family antitoxin [Gemmatimonadaceae bacterium]